MHNLCLLATMAINKVKQNVSLKQEESLFNCLRLTFCCLRSFRIFDIQLLKSNPSNEILFNKPYFAI